MIYLREDETWIFASSVLNRNHDTYLGSYRQKDALYRRWYWTGRGGALHHTAFAKTDSMTQRKGTDRGRAAAPPLGSSTPISAKR